MVTHAAWLNHFVKMKEGWTGTAQNQSYIFIVSSRASKSNDILPKDESGSPSAGSGKGGVWGIGWATESTWVIFFECTSDFESSIDGNGNVDEPEGVEIVPDELYEDCV